MAESIVSEEGLEVESISFKELISKNLKIPAYQRPYVWTEKEIKKLFNQFAQHNDRKDNKPNFYLGSIVLHKDTNGFFNIIDGQQRITTLLAIYNKQIENQQLQYSNPISISSIKRNYDYFKDKQDQIPEIDLDQINVTVVTTISEDMAYNFFETLNTGGVRLGGADILKAHHLRTIEKMKNRNEFAKKWENHNEYIEDLNQILTIIRRMNFINANKYYPKKYAPTSAWKNTLTEEFIDFVGKKKEDVGYSLVKLEGNTHTIVSDKYCMRQPINEGENYLNFSLSFMQDFEDILVNYDELNIDNETDKDELSFSKLMKELIEPIDGTIDLRKYFRIALLAFVDMFGREQITEFSYWLFRHIYSLRLSETSRIYEATVINHVNNTMLLEIIYGSYRAEDVLNYLENYEPKYNLTGLSGVRQRFHKKVCDYFGIEKDFDKELKQKIKQIKK